MKKMRFYAAFILPILLLGGYITQQDKLLDTNDGLPQTVAASPEVSAGRQAPVSTETAVALHRPELFQQEVDHMENPSIVIYKAARKLERVLTNDPGTGVMRHADAGYQRAIDVANERGVHIPMRA